MDHPHLKYQRLIDFCKALPPTSVAVAHPCDEASLTGAMDAAKAGTQVYAQLTSSSYSMMHAQANINGSANMGVTYSYSGEVSGTVPAISTPG